MIISYNISVYIFLHMKYHVTYHVMSVVRIYTSVCLIIVKYHMSSSYNIMNMLKQIRAYISSLDARLRQVEQRMNRIGNAFEGDSKTYTAGDGICIDDNHKISVLTDNTTIGIDDMGRLKLMCESYHNDEHTSASSHIGETVRLKTHTINLSDHTWSAIAYGFNQFIALSTDSHWTIISSSGDIPTTTGLSNIPIVSMTYGIDFQTEEEQLVAIGSDNNGCILSASPQQWKSYSLFPSAALSPPCVMVAHGDGIYIYLLQNLHLYVYYKRDFNVKSIAILTTDWCSVTYGKSRDSDIGYFVFVSSEHVCYIHDPESDTTTETTINAPSCNWTAVTFGTCINMNTESDETTSDVFVIFDKKKHTIAYTSDITSGWKVLSNVLPNRIECDVTKCVVTKYNDNYYWIAALRNSQYCIWSNGNLNEWSYFDLNCGVHNWNDIATDNNGHVVVLTNDTNTAVWIELVTIPWSPIDEDDIQCTTPELEYNV